LEDPRTFGRQVNKLLDEKLAHRADRYRRGQMDAAERARLETVAALDKRQKEAGLPLLTQHQVAAQVGYSQPSIQQDRAFLARYAEVVKPAPEVLRIEATVPDGQSPGLSFDAAEHLLDMAAHAVETLD